MQSIRLIFISEHEYSVFECEEKKSSCSLEHESFIMQSQTGLAQVNRTFLVSTISWVFIYSIILFMQFILGGF